ARHGAWPAGSEQTRPTAGQLGSATAAGVLPELPGCMAASDCCRSVVDTDLGAAAARGQLAVQLSALMVADRLGGDDHMADAIQPEGPWAVAEPAPAMQVGVLGADHQPQRLDQATLGHVPVLVLV